VIEVLAASFAEELIASEVLSEGIGGEGVHVEGEGEDGDVVVHDVPGEPGRAVPHDHVLLLARRNVDLAEASANTKSAHVVLAQRRRQSDAHARAVHQVGEVCISGRISKMVKGRRNRRDREVHRPLL